jgi:hypothetical protein
MKKGCSPVTKKGSGKGAPTKHPVGKPGAKKESKGPSTGEVEKYGG